MSDAMLSEQELYSLFYAGKFKLLEGLWQERMPPLVASMLSGHYLRRNLAEDAGRFIPHLVDEEERKLKTRTQQLLPRLNDSLTVEPCVHLLMLSCNRVHYVEHALRQLAATDYKNYAVYILDNHSTDGSWEIVRDARALFPPSVEVYIRRAAFNTGRPVGHNTLLTSFDHQDAAFIAIVDDDLVDVPPDWLRRMVLTAQIFPRAAAVGGKALSPGGAKIIHGGVRRLMQFDGDEIDTTNRMDTPDYGQFDYVDKTDHVIGCLHLYRAQPLFTDLGLFDIRYSPCQCVDMDHHFRARLLGYDIIYNGLIEFTHARAMHKAAQTDNALQGNALGNLAKLVYKFNVADMQTLIKDTGLRRRQWMEGVEV